MKEYKEHSRHQPQGEVGNLLKVFKTNKHGFKDLYLGISKSNQLPVCLDLEFADGSRIALTYSSVHQVTYDIESGITILTANHQVQIKGRNLASVFEYLEQFRVNYLREHSGIDLKAKGIFIESIKLE